MAVVAEGPTARLDLGLPKVIEIGYEHGLVESTALRVDDTWSAIKFTHPKKGKVYRNTYGTLARDEPTARSWARSPRSQPATPRSRLYSPL